MARIALNLSDEARRKAVAEALAETRHTLVDLENITHETSIAEAVERIIAQPIDVVVMDYWVEDAASVKLMQMINDHGERPEFIFIESSSAPAPREDVLMALNEGARAFLPADFNLGALLNYIERALSGPGRFRHNTVNDAGQQEATARLEEQMGLIRAKNKGYEKLISYLLSTPPSAQARKALVVSDSPFQLELLKKILEEHNLPTISASNAADGLNLALSEKPRIIVSDLELEGQNGIEFCQAVKFTHKLIPCHFVICTANQDKFNVVMAPGNGVDDCLLKPSGPGDASGFIARVALGLLL